MCVLYNCFEIDQETPSCVVLSDLSMFPSSFKSYYYRGVAVLATTHQSQGGRIARRDVRDAAPEGQRLKHPVLAAHQKLLKQQQKVSISYLKVNETFSFQL